MTTILSRASRILFISIVAMGFGLVPANAYAADEDPLCMLIVSTPRGYEVFSGERDVEIRSGERIILGWIGQNMTDARNRDNKAISSVGLEVLTAQGSGTYEYTFSSGRDSTTCSANLTMAGSAQTTAPTPAEPVTGGSFTVGTIPLLSGGVAQARTSIPVAYVQVTNTGSTPASVEGFTLRQNGSASVDSVIGFSMSDNLGGSRSTIGGAEGDTHFDGDEAYVPLLATIPAKQFRIFTIKAILGQNSDGSLGKSLMLDVASIDTTANVKGTFPIKGTTWTFAY